MNACCNVVRRIYSKSKACVIVTTSTALMAKFSHEVRAEACQASNMLCTMTQERGVCGKEAVASPKKSGPKKRATEVRNGILAHNFAGSS